MYCSKAASLVTLPSGTISSGARVLIADVDMSLRAKRTPSARRDVDRVAKEAGIGDYAIKDVCRNGLDTASRVGVLQAKNDRASAQRSSSMAESLAFSLSLSISSSR